MKTKRQIITQYEEATKQCAKHRIDYFTKQKPRMYYTISKRYEEEALALGFVLEIPVKETLRYIRILEELEE